MFEWHGLFLPAGEKHLVDWMRKKRQRLADGRPTYQQTKYAAALNHLPAHARGLALDVGAHAGLWSMQMMQDFDFVAAVEPVVEHAACWLRNVGGISDEVTAYQSCEHSAATAVGLNANARCRLFRVAVGAAPRDRVELITAPSSSGDTFIRPEGAVATPGLVHAETVRMFTVDELALPEGVPVNLFKIDCEGYEIEVLRGARGLISRDRPVIVVEQKPGKGRQFGFSDTDAVEYLKSTHGYEVAREISGDFIMWHQWSQP